MGKVVALLLFSSFISLVSGLSFVSGLFSLVYTSIYLFHSKPPPSPLSRGDMKWFLFSFFENLHMGYNPFTNSCLFSYHRIISPLMSERASEALSTYTYSHSLIPSTTYHLKNPIIRLSRKQLSSLAWEICAVGFGLVWFGLVWLVWFCVWFAWFWLCLALFGLLCSAGFRIGECGSGGDGDEMVKGRGKGMDACVRAWMHHSAQQK